MLLLGITALAALIISNVSAACSAKQTERGKLLTTIDNEDWCLAVGFYCYKWSILHNKCDIWEKHSLNSNEYTLFWVKKSDNGDHCIQDWCWWPSNVMDGSPASAHHIETTFDGKLAAIEWDINKGEGLDIMDVEKNAKIDLDGANNGDELRWYEGTKICPPFGTEVCCLQWDGDIRGIPNQMGFVVINGPNRMISGRVAKFDCGGYHVGDPVRFGN